MSEDVKSVVDALDGLKSELDAKLAEHTASLEAGVKESDEKMVELTGKIDELSAKHVEAQEKLENEIADLSAKGDSLIAGIPAEAQTWGEQLVKSDAFAHMAQTKDRAANIRVEVKNTTINSNLSALFGDNTTVFPNQRPGVIGGDFVPVTVRQSIPSIPVSTDAVNALRESASSMAAAETAQGALKPESTISFEQYNVAIETVAHWIKVSTRLMADAPAVAAYVDRRLRDGLNQRVDNQLINGDGTSPNISGLLDSGNFTAFSPSANDNLADSINRAKYTMWATGNEPDTVYVNPADWGEWERTREGVGSGLYLHGTAGMAGMSPFGVRVVLTTHVSAGTFIIAAISSNVAIYDRQSATVEMGYVDDDFTRNLVTIRAEERLALSVDKASAVYAGDIAVS